PHVLRSAKLARPVIDLDFADAIAARRRQDRDEAVQLAVEPDLVENLLAVALHAAVVVVQANAGDHADQAVEDTAGPNLVPGIVTDAFPATDNIQATVQCREESLDFFRIVLEVGVQRQNDVAAGGVEAGGQGRRLAEIPTKA